MDTSILKVQNLTKIFPVKSSFFNSNKKNNIIALNDISFELHEGEILGLLGPNGAGKTTALQILISTLKPTSGSITYFGKDFFTHTSEILQHIAFASSSVQLPSLLTVQQNLDIYGRLYGLSSVQRLERSEELLKTFGMWSLRSSRLGNLSLGQLMRVMIAKAFLAFPKIVILDEATSALDPEISRLVRKFLRMQRREFKTSMLIASHNMAEVAEICDRVLVMDHGSIIADSTPAELVAQIPTARIQFIAGESIEYMKQFFEHNGIHYGLHAGTVEVEVEDSKIPNLLKQFAQEGITYSHISIAKPTLEDYFLKKSDQKELLFSKETV